MSNRIKNLIIATTTAALYWNWIAGSAQRISATILVFAFLLMALRDADKQYRRKQRR